MTNRAPSYAELSLRVEELEDQLSRAKEGVELIYRQMLRERQAGQTGLGYLIDSIVRVRGVFE